MTEEARKKRNTSALAECNPWVGERMARVLDRMEGRGFRPRIQCAARSGAAQLLARTLGKSGVTWSLHQARTTEGKPDSLACDVIDDNEPLRPSGRYVLALAVESRAEGLETGIRWGHETAGKERVEAAIERFRLTGDVGFALAPDGKGWDPCHVQVPRAVLSVADAKGGKRP